MTESCCAKGLPETREAQEQAIDVRFDLRNALLPLAGFWRIEGYLREAEALASTLDDQRRLGWVSAYMSGSCSATGDHATDARTFAQRVAILRGSALTEAEAEAAALPT